MEKANLNVSRIAYILKMIGIVIMSAIIASILMFLVYLIPTQRMTSHVSSGIDTYANEGSYPWIAEGYKSFILDSETDFMMLLGAIYPSENAALDAMQVPHVGYTGKESSLDNLLTYINGGTSPYVENYGRYWHGYLVFLKPFLFLFDLQDFRVFNLITQFALILTLTYLLAKRSKWSVLPLFTLLVVLNPVSCALSMQYSTCFYITMISSIVVLGRNNWDERNSDFFFLEIGILIAFFDFLTYPLLTLAVPLILLLSVMNCSKFGKQLIAVIRKSLVWLLGYAGMWVSKWVIGSIVSGDSFFDEAFSAVSKRASVSDIPTSALFGGVEIQRWDAIKINIGVLLKWPYLLLFLFLVLIWIYLLKKKEIQFRAKSLPIHLFIALYPLVWFIVLANHSYEHPRLAYRELGISVFSILWFMMGDLDHPGCSISRD